MSSQAPATQSHQALAVANAGAKRDIRDFFQTATVADQLKMALPRFLTPDRMIRVFMTQINGDEKLQKCSMDSLLSSLMRAAQMGLEPDGRHGHLIPRWNSKKNCMEASFQADYKGLISLVRKNPEVKDIYAELVYEHDQFRITKGLHRDLTHEIDIRKDRGELLGAYSVLVYANGYSGFDFMTKAELYAIRERSDGWQAYRAQKISSTPWASDEGEMCKKTVLKRLLKLADLDPDTTSRLTIDTEVETTRLESPTFDPQPQLSNPQSQPALPSSTGGESARESAGETTAGETTAGATGQPPAQPTVEKPAKVTRNKLPTRPPQMTAPVPVKTGEFAKPGYSVPAEPAGQAAATQQSQSELSSQSAAPAGEETLSAKVERLLKKGGYTNGEFISVALANGWCDPCDPEATPVSSLGDEKLKLFLEDWGTVTDEIDGMRKRGGK